jgi:hypothetical protein
VKEIFAVFFCHSMNVARSLTLSYKLASFFILILINVYMPCENKDSTDDFMSLLAHLYDILDLFPHCNIIIGGDLNADFTRSTTHTYTYCVISLT